MNLCIFGGNFVRDPELKTIGINNTSVVNFTLAVNRKYKDKSNNWRDEVTYVNCEAWDNAAQTITDHCVKGDYLVVYASAKSQSWNDKVTGEKRSAMRFRVERFEFIPGLRRQESTSENKEVEEFLQNEEIPF